MTSDAPRCPACFDDHLPGSPDCPAGRLGRVVDGRFRLDRILGCGGFGAVFEALHLGLGKSFAIKTLLPRLAQNGPIVERFLREARTAASLDHPGIVQVTDVGLDSDGVPWLAMEMLEGEALSDVIIRRGALPPNEAIAIADAALEALSFAHRRGVVHRDLKPHNVFLAARDGSLPRVKLLDFGLAKVLAEQDAPQLTKTGEFVGTLQYASPEQISDARSADPRGDVYGMGAMLYTMLTGRSPASARTASEILTQVVTGRIGRHPRELEPRVPPALDALVARALSFDPAERPADAAALRAELAAARDDASSIAEQATIVLPGAASPTAGLPEDATGAPPLRTSRLWLRIAAVVAAAVVGATLWTNWPFGSTPTHPRPVPEHNAPVAPPGMIAVPGASFAMGSDQAELEGARQACLSEVVNLVAADQLDAACPSARFEREQPLREVIVPPFFLDATEVRNADLARWLAGLPDLVARDGVVERGGAVLLDTRVDSAGEDLSGLTVGATGRVGVRVGRGEWPAVQVSWATADAYCRGRGARLPTEAEWELAARGSERRPYPWGDSAPACDAVVFGRGWSCTGQPLAPGAVGSATGDVTALGIHDLGGNVAEWVADTFVAPYPACPAPCRSPRVDHPGDGPRVIRGGSFAEFADATRAAGRSRAPAASLLANVGFRCAADTP